MFPSLHTYAASGLYYGTIIYLALQLGETHKTGFTNQVALLRRFLGDVERMSADSLCIVRPTHHSPTILCGGVHGSDCFPTISGDIRPEARPRGGLPATFGIVRLRHGTERGDSGLELGWRVETPLVHCLRTMCIMHHICVQALGHLDYGMSFR